MADPKIYSYDNLPEDAVVATGKANYAPINEAQIYQVELNKVELRDNTYPGATDKYQLVFEFAIVDEGEFYGRRLWKNAALSLKPTGKKGPTFLYKIVTKILRTELSWDDCASYAPDGNIKALMANLIELCGKQLRVSIENTKKDDGSIKSSIKTFYEAEKDLPAFDQEKSTAMGEKYKNAPDGSEDVKVGEPLPF